MLQSFPILAPKSLSAKIIFYLGKVLMKLFTFSNPKKKNLNIRLINNKILETGIPMNFERISENL